MVPGENDLHTGPILAPAGAMTLHWMVFRGHLMARTPPRERANPVTGTRS